MERLTDEQRDRAAGCVGVLFANVARYFAADQDTAFRDRLYDSGAAAYLRAARCWRPGGGTEFAPYAAVCVRRAVRQSWLKGKRSGAYRERRIRALAAEVRREVDGLTNPRRHTPEERLDEVRRSAPEALAELERVLNNVAAMSFRDDEAAYRRESVRVYHRAEKVRDQLRGGLEVRGA
jgi:DNA-directed RNA polymerase specialized sigma subunit